MSGVKNCRLAKLRLSPSEHSWKSSSPVTARPAIRLLNASPELAKERAARGAIRQAPKENFFDRIKHYINEGDTALHMAAAAKQTRIAEELILISRGAVRARNRRGAEPLHYAVDGGPGSPGWIPTSRP